MLAVTVCCAQLALLASFAGIGSAAGSHFGTLAYEHYGDASCSVIIASLLLVVAGISALTSARPHEPTAQTSDACAEQRSELAPLFVPAHFDDAPASSTLSRRTWAVHQGESDET